MIQFKHIKSVDCPHCGTRFREIRINGIHCNGSQNELIEFRCGHSYEYSPNFERFKEIKACPNTDEAKAEKITVDKLFDNIRKKIDKSKLSHDQRLTLQHKIYYYEGDSKTK